MIKANELRLGNYILEAGEPSNIYMIDRGGISFYRINDIAVNKETGCTLNGGEDRFKHIPITPEWLGKLGFTIPDDHGFMMRAYRDVIRIKIDERLGSPIVKIGELHFTNILNVHQFQNVYLDLTGEELTINNEYLQIPS